jgi:hypothetical protein
MRKAILPLLAATALLSACASSQSDSGLGHAKVNVAEPEVIIKQVSYMPPVARDMTGGIPVKYRVRVANRSGESITLTRIDVQSLGYGAYTLNPQSHSFKAKIGPEQYQTVEFWMPAFISDPTLYGANGPVTLRAVLHYDSTVGQFDQVTVQQVHERPTDETDSIK